MAGLSRAERTLRQDRYGTVEYAVRKDGTMEAKDWLESQTEGVQAGFDVLFRRLLSESRINNDQQFHRVDDNLWVFKRGDNRMLCVRHGPRCLLTHRYKKNTTNTPPGDIKHARTIEAEHFAWEAAFEKSERRK